MTPLEAIIRAEIAASGPMTLHDYMALCLAHPEHGYYMRRDPLGAAGDFTTAPEISQMFGEMIGLWLAEVWHGLGRPAPFRLVELGPGRGTLMADILRAGRAAPGFLDSAEVWLVETSPALRAEQARQVPGARQAGALAEVPAGPFLLVANEFFDALPVRQFVRTAKGWAERMVGLDGDRLAFGLRPAPDLGPAPVGAVRERSPAGEAAAAEIGARIGAAGGAALIVDYGYAAPTPAGADTVQALRAHAYADPLEAPGEADITAHVDFGALARAAKGAAASPLVPQGAWLERLGIGARAATLARARPERAAEIGGQLRRLTAPEEMGTLFRVMALGQAGAPPFPGFEGER